MTFFDLTCSDHVTILPRAISGDGCVGGVLSLLDGPNRFGEVARSSEEDKHSVAVAMLEVAGGASLWQSGGFTYTAALGGLQRLRLG
jgi:hypothetical protein